MTPKHVGLALLILSLTTPAAAGSLEGRWAGQFNGQSAQAALSVRQGAVRGTLDIGGYVYRLEASGQGDAVQGRMLDQDGVAVPLGMALEGDTLRLQVHAQGAGVPPLELVLARGTGTDARAPSSAEPAVQVDPVLVGDWVRSESYTSGDFSAASETRVTLFPDGTYRYGPGRVIGGGDAGSFDSGGGGGAPGGRWRTANRILYTREGGAGWTPYARYYVEGNQLLLTFGDGSRELWQRR